MVYLNTSPRIDNIPCIISLLAYSFSFLFFPSLTHLRQPGRISFVSSADSTSPNIYLLSVISHLVAVVVEIYISVTFSRELAFCTFPLNMEFKVSFGFVEETSNICKDMWTPLSCHSCFKSSVPDLTSTSLSINKSPKKPCDAGWEKIKCSLKWCPEVRLTALHSSVLQEWTGREPEWWTSFHWHQLL